MLPTGALRYAQGARLVAAGGEPAAGREVERALGAGGHVGQAEVPVAVDPGGAHDEIVRRAVGRHQAKDLAALPQPDARAPCAVQRAEQRSETGGK